MSAERSKTTGVLMSGNEAAAEGAIRAGCKFYSGYPITPQNELIAYMADQLPLRGGIFVQAESELAAINMLYGASAAGVRCMTSSSSPGISLKQEGISYLAGSELPAVIVNISRGGPGLGDIRPAQSDYFQTTRGGGHGDYRCLSLAPASAQEMADLTYLAFDLADSYRNPVIIQGDGTVGQMMEPVRLDHLKPPSPASFRPVKGALEEHNQRLQQKYEEIQRREVRCEMTRCEDAEVLLVAYGVCARIATELVVKPPRELPARVGILRPITLWPFPSEQLAALAERVRAVLTVEMSAGQLVEDVRLAVEGRCPVHLLGRPGGAIPTAREIADRLLAILS